MTIVDAHSLTVLMSGANRCVWFQWPWVYSKGGMRGEIFFRRIYVVELVPFDPERPNLAR